MIGESVDTVVGGVGVDLLHCVNFSHPSVGVAALLQFGTVPVQVGAGLMGGVIQALLVISSSRSAVILEPTWPTKMYCDAVTPAGRPDGQQPNRP